MKLEPTFDPRCGTTAGYCAHQKRNERFCSPCQEAKKIRDHQIYEANKEKKAIQTKAWKLANLELDKQIKKDWYLKNKEKTQIKARLWYLKNQELTKQRSEKWTKENPEKAKANARKVAHRRRVRRKNGIIEPYTEIQVLELYGTNCHICNKPIDLQAPRTVKEEGWYFGLHIDHIIPISKGGSDTLNNVKPAHGICNVRKGAKLENGNSGVSA